MIEEKEDIPRCDRLRRARPSSTFAEVRRLLGFRFESAVAIRIFIRHTSSFFDRSRTESRLQTQNLVLVVSSQTDIAYAEHRNLREHSSGTREDFPAG